MSDQARALNQRVRAIVDPDLLESLSPRDSRVEEFEESLSDPFELHHQELDKAMAAFREDDLDASFDKEMAVAIYKALPITPRQARQQSFWWHLSLWRYPDVVRSRWGTTSARFLGRPGRNALSRLWWGAHMTSSLDQEYLGAVFENQDVFEALVGRRLGRFPVAVKAARDVLGDVGGKRAREVIRDFNHVLSTLVLEGLDEGRLCEELVLLNEAWGSR